jgi:hypothetical protein
LGLYHPANPGAWRGEAVLFCNAFGQEAIRAHRLFRVLAERLSRNGFAVLRFDYFATGDSMGEDDAGEMTGWCSDIRLADAELSRLCGATATTWFGLRLGASLAALASAIAPSPPKLLLWDSIQDGTRYLGDLREAHLTSAKLSYGARWQTEAALREAITTEADGEALGFPLSQQLKSQLQALTPSALAQLSASRVTMLTGPDAQDPGDLAVRLGQRGTPVRQQQLATAINWASNEAMNSSIVPPELLSLIDAALMDRP